MKIIRWTLLSTAVALFLINATIAQTTPDGFPPLRITTMNHLSLWTDDQIFYDLNHNGMADIGDLITNRLADEYGVFVHGNWFNLLRLDNEQNGHWKGQYLLPFVDDSNVMFCPSKEDYLGYNPLFKVIGDILGVGTEALYLARENGVSEFKPVFIQESVLKAIWFVYQNGTHYWPNQTIGGTIQFYWPPNFIVPHAKHPNQRIYTLFHFVYPQSISDGRIGCVPSLVSSSLNCQANGFDCELDGECVKDASLRSNAKSSPDYFPAITDVAFHPEHYFKWPHIFNVCPTPNP